MVHPLMTIGFTLLLSTQGIFTITIYKKNIHYYSFISVQQQKSTKIWHLVRKSCTGRVGRVLCVYSKNAPILFGVMLGPHKIIQFVQQLVCVTNCE